MTHTLDAIRPCLEGAVPAVIATCARDGTPNVSYISEVHYVDATHVALSFQFFSKTRQNVQENPRATVVVIHPDNGAQYKLAVHYLRTEEAGPLFESMRAKLSGIASHTGMTGVFRLRGADVYRVESVVQVYGTPLATPPPRLNALAALRQGIARLAGAADLATQLDGALAVLREQFRCSHAMVLMHDPALDKLYTVASTGYSQSGVGAEIALGQGVIGVAAQERTPIRITHATVELRYGRAAREAAASHGLGERLEQEIPFPGLADSQSQIAVPILAGERLAGVLFAESVEPGRFGYDEEDALVLLATHIGVTAQFCDGAAETAEAADDEVTLRPQATMPRGQALRIRRYAENDSIFVDEDYLIKGVAGAILWRLVRGFVDESRTEYSNRELRLDPGIRLPDVSENLEARLILLQRRLEERCPGLQIEKTGRGRFRLKVSRPLSLSEMQSGAQERPGLPRPN